MTKKNSKGQLPFRLNVVFLIVFILFSILIVQLGVVQILEGADYQDEINHTIQDTANIPVPRGKIYDRYYETVVNNEPFYSITYTPPKNVQAKEKIEVAEKLTKYISMDDKEQIKKITDRNKREYIYLRDKELADARLSKEEASKLSNAEQYTAILERIPKNELKEIVQSELEIIIIKKELDKALALTPQIIKNENVTPTEYAKVAEHLDELPGINATTDWEREYPYKDSFNSLLGSITTQKQGIPKEEEDYYLTRGYNRNDRVGKTGLEEQYEELLRGRKEQIEYTTDKSNKVVDSEVIVPGERGKDLVLTIDMELQKKVDKIIKKNLKKEVGNSPHLEDAMVVVMNPKTGELLAVSGQHYDRKNRKFENASYKALYDAHRVGSSIKGATVLAGYQSGVIKPNTYFYDAPIKLKGTPKKSSWKNMGSVNELKALQQSSNVYMFNIALRMGGEYGNPNGRSASFDKSAFQEMRNYYQQFGLGTETGIDFPFESTGYKGPIVNNAGIFMDLSIGQYDTFTTLQLAQYVSTIANDGYRIRPHFLKEVREPNPTIEEIGPVFRTINTEVLNRIEMDDKYIKNVQEGFRRVYQTPNGTATRYFKNNYKIAGKTGTAQNEIYKDNKKIATTENLTLVGYAPHDNPEVAYSIVVPNTKEKSDAISSFIGSDIMDAYFDLKKERSKKKDK